MNTKINLKGKIIDKNLNNNIRDNDQNFYWELVDLLFNEKTRDSIINFINSKEYAKIEFDCWWDLFRLTIIETNKEIEFEIEISILKEFLEEDLINETIDQNDEYVIPGIHLLLDNFKKNNDLQEFEDFKGKCYLDLNYSSDIEVLGEYVEIIILSYNDHIKTLFTNVKSIDDLLKVCEIKDINSDDIKEWQLNNNLSDSIVVKSIICAHIVNYVTWMGMGVETTKPTFEVKIDQNGFYDFESIYGLGKNWGENIFKLLKDNINQIVYDENGNVCPGWVIDEFGNVGPCPGHPLAIFNPTRISNKILRNINKWNKLKEGR